MKITVYLTSDHGNGHTQSIGEYGDWSDIELRVGMFSKDSVITFEVENDDV